MNRPIFMLAILLSAMLSLSCSKSHDMISQADAEKELRQLEASLVAAIQRKDTDKLNLIWADEYLGTAPDGRVVSKPELMSAVKTGLIEIESIELDDLKLRLLGDVAVLTGHAEVKASVEKEDYSGSYRGTGIFIKRDGRWQVIGVQIGPTKRC